MRRLSRYCHKEMNRIALADPWEWKCPDRVGLDWGREGERRWEADSGTGSADLDRHSAHEGMNWPGDFAAGIDSGDRRNTLGLKLVDWN